MDDINIDAFVMEAAVALEDEGMLRKFIMEKATIMVERFLVRLFYFSGCLWCLRCLPLVPTEIIFFLNTFFCSSSV